MKEQHRHGGHGTGCGCGCEHHEHGTGCGCGCERHEHGDGCGDKHHEHGAACGCGDKHHEHGAVCGCGCERHEHGNGCGCGGERHEHGDGCGHERHEHGDGCGCGHDHGDDGAARRELPRLALAFALFAAGMLLPLPGGAKTALLIGCYAVSGYDVLLAALRSLRGGRMMNESFLMAVASLAAIAIGEVTEGCAVMLFYQVGECFQSYAVGRSRRRIRALLEMKAEEAYVRRDGEFICVDPAAVQVGEEIRIRPGERVPLDAVVTEGMSDMDTSALTGESVARAAEPGDTVLAGFVAQNGVIVARVTKPLAESSVSRILSLVEDAQARKAPVERFITTFARVYTPVVVALAAALALLPPLALGGWRVWIYRALTFLVASCPCALVISVPLCYFAGVGAAARRGILIKGGDSLDALCRVEQFVLDKTGTLTTGEFAVTHVHSCVGVGEEQLIALIAGAESGSTHPLAAAALREAALRGIVPAAFTPEREIAGRGVQARGAQGVVLAGSLALMRESGVRGWEETESLCRGETARIYAALDGRAIGFICLSDVVKPGAAQAVAALKEMGVRRTVMLTGDSAAPAQAAAAQAGIDEVYAQLLPQDKLSRLEGILAQGGAAFVGDGINDAPALVRATVGIAMGALGSDAAIEAADVVLMTDEIDRLPATLAVARRVRAIARQNVIIALGVKVLVLALAALGLAGMWAAVFADVGVALLCVLNAMRAMR